MANLKLDLINQLKNEKYYNELEMVRLAQDPNINYKNKIKNISDILLEITSINEGMVLIEQYFVEQQPQDQQLTAKENNIANEPIRTKPLPGQTHGE